MKTRNLIILMLLALTIYNCSYDSESDLIAVTDDDEQNDNPDNGPDNGVNYTNDIKPIMQSSCVGCHASPPVNGAPFSLVNFDQVSQRSGGILNAMSRQNGAAGIMPPSGRLPQATIDLVQQWIDNGKPEN